MFCQYGVWVERTCPEGEAFDWKTLGCVVAAKPPSYRPKCYEGEMKPVAGQCALYETEQSDGTASSSASVQNDSNAAASVQCPGCEEAFHIITELAEHCERDHSNGLSDFAMVRVVLDSWKPFENWLAEKERETYTKLVKRRYTRKSSKGNIYVYMCQHARVTASPSQSSSISTRSSGKEQRPLQATSFHATATNRACRKAATMLDDGSRTMGLRQDRGENRPLKSDLAMSAKKWNWSTIRNIIAFWIFGLCNNYGYVIMLSAAEDIMVIQEGGNVTKQIQNCEDHITARHCTAISTGAVLLADNLPSLFVKLTFPFFMHRIPFVFRHLLVCLLQASSYFVVAFSVNVPMSLAGVCFAAFGSGIGEISYLALASHYPTLAIAAWSSGTGAAGLLGSFSYAFLTDRSMADLQPKVALLIQLFIPIVFAITYFFVLVVPDDVHQPGWNPKSWIVPDEGHEHEIRNTDEEEEDESKENNATSNLKVPQRKLTFIQRVQLIVPLLHLMIPLSFVYIGEYLINQGVTQLVIFNCHEGFHLTLGAQYRWYQVLYQLGVFISRSSVKLFALPTWSLYLLPVLQATNFFFFFFEAIYWFVPSIGIIFGLIVFEGLLGGAAYVNTFDKIHKMVPADVREYSLSVATVGDSIGINFAGFMSIPIHNFICARPMPSVR
ncbi:hypothetical protein Y032_0056g2677 [Ancylostoma ceylanicum]|uniref:C2H2-type domain-containing protein n=1 Tax=Ancylostoma ceylanicum TaxID=53326 RepID=A0A016U578_9BILA|nr:hypothetical protein Y032_0056g2677 [Ancylostoma ceylanicum]